MHVCVCVCICYIYHSTVVYYKPGNQGISKDTTKDYNSTWPSTNSLLILNLADFFFSRQLVYNAYGPVNNN